MARLSWAARLYIAAVVVVAAAVLAMGPFGGPQWWRDVAVLGLLVVIFESTEAPVSSVSPMLGDGTSAACVMLGDGATFVSATVGPRSPGFAPPDRAAAL